MPFATPRAQRWPLALLQPAQLWLVFSEPPSPHLPSPPFWEQGIPEGKSPGQVLVGKAQPYKPRDHGQLQHTLHAPFLLGLDTSTSKGLMVWLSRHRHP